MNQDYKLRTKCPFCGAPFVSASERPETVTLPPDEDGHDRDPYDTIIHTERFACDTEIECDLVADLDFYSKEVREYKVIHQPDCCFNVMVINTLEPGAKYNDGDKRALSLVRARQYGWCV
jgi:hypothetical protein